MKQLFTTLTMMLVPLWAMAQTDYAPLLEEGKTWHYTYHNWATGKTYTFTDKLSGDSVVNGVTYMKYVSHDQSEPARLLREDGGKVYMYDTRKEAETLLYDFTLSVGDNVENVQSELPDAEVRVTDVNNVQFQDKSLKMLTINECMKGDEPPYDPISLSQVWVEGMGSAGGLFMLYLPNLGSFVKLDYIEMPDGTEFHFGDVIAGVKTAGRSEPTERSAVFGLDGRKVQNPSRGVFVIGGKKVIVK